DRHVVAELRAVLVEREGRRPAAEPIDRLGSGHTRPEQDDRRDAAEVGQVSLEDVERNPRGDAGVDRVAPAFEQARPGLRREVVARAHHPALTKDGGAALRDAQGEGPLFSDRRERGRSGALDRDLAHQSLRSIIGDSERYCREVIRISASRVPPYDNGMFLVWDERNDALTLD